MVHLTALEWLLIVGVVAVVFVVAAWKDAA